MTIRTILLLCLLPPLIITAGCEPTERQRPVIDIERSNPAGNGSRFPSFHSSDGETLYMSWLTRLEEEVAAIEFARYRTGAWEEPQTVTVGTNLRIDWVDHPGIGTLEEVPVLHWMRMREADPSIHDPQIAFPAESLLRWSYFTPYEQRGGPGSGSVSMAPVGESELLVSWTENRLPAAGASPHDDGSLPLYSALVESGGLAGPRQLVTSRICGTGPAAMTALPAGAAAVYAGCDEQNSWMPMLIRYDRASESWGEPAALPTGRWQPVTGPAAAPAVAVRGDRMVVVWLAQSGDRTRIQAAWSEDGGAHFEEPVLLGEGEVMGRADVTASPDGSFFISWMAGSGSLSTIYLQRFDDGQPAGPARPVGTTDRGDESGRPVLGALSGSVMVAWTQTEPVFRVRTVYVSYDR